MILAGLNQNQLILVIVLSVVGVLIFAAAIFLFYFFVISRSAYRKQIRDLDRKSSYLDALLIGQISQYIHRLEVISHTNLLFGEKHREYSHRFKEIYENNDKYCEQIIKQLKTLTANNQYKGIKSIILEARKSVEVFEELTNNLDSELYEIIKPEEEARQTILKLKDNYRRVKQIYQANSADLELVSSSIIRVFEKLDQLFARFDELIEGGNYEDATAIIPTISKVVTSLNTSLSLLPNLCLSITKIVPGKIEEISTEYRRVEASGIPLFNLAFPEHVNSWEQRLDLCKEKVVSLSTSRVDEELAKIQEEIEGIRAQLRSEVKDEEEFNKDSADLHARANELEKAYFKICSLLPSIKENYEIDEEHLTAIEELNENISKLGNSKRNLDNFVHSATKQPYSVLKKKLDELKEDYSLCRANLQEFKAYLDFLRNSTEEAYSLVFIYYHHLKNHEATLRALRVPEFEAQFKDSIEESYALLNTIYSTLKVAPINVDLVNEKVEQLKNITKNLFEEIDEKSRLAHLAESGVVYCNRDRLQQSEIHQQLNMLEKEFYQGEFQKVYNDTSVLYHRAHVEEGKNDRR